MKQYLAHLFHFNTIHHINQYCASINPQTGLSPLTSTCLTTALEDPYFDWTDNMPEGPCVGFPVLSAIIYLAKHNNPAGVLALNTLFQRTDIDWETRQGEKRVSPIECLAYMAITQTDALNKFLVLTKRLQFSLNKSFTFGKLEGRSFFFALMQSIRHHQFLFFDDYVRLIQNDALNWNEATQSRQHIDLHEYPQTPLYYLTLAASRGDKDALAILPRVVNKPNLNWYQKTDELYIEYERYEWHIGNLIDVSTQEQKNVWRPFAKLMEAALKYPAVQGIFFWVLATEFENNSDFAPFCYKVMSGFTRDQNISLFISATKFVDQLLSNNRPRDDFDFKCIRAVEILAQYANSLNYTDTQRWLDTLIPKHNIHIQVVPVFNRPPPYNPSLIAYINGAAGESSSIDANHLLDNNARTYTNMLNFAPNFVPNQFNQNSMSQSKGGSYKAKY